MWSGSILLCVEVVTALGRPAGEGVSTFDWMWHEMKDIEILFLGPQTCLPGHRIPMSSKCSKFCEIIWNLKVKDVHRKCACVCVRERDGVKNVWGARSFKSFHIEHGVQMLVECSGIWAIAHDCQDHELAKQFGWLAPKLSEAVCSRFHFSGRMVSIHFFQCWCDFVRVLCALQCESHTSCSIEDDRLVLELSHHQTCKA